MVTKTLFLGALVASVLVAACGGGGSDPDPVTPPPGGGGTARILSVGQVSIGGVTIGDAAPGDPVEVTGDVTATYSPATAAVGTLVTTCGAQSLNGTVKASTAGSVTFSHNAWLYDTDCSATVTFAAADFASVTKTVTFRTKAAPAVPTATVMLSATPTTVVAGESTTLRWTTLGAANCQASNGWNGSVASAGDSLVVTPATTTTYGIECWGPTGLTTGVVSTTVTVTPKPVTYPAVVIAWGAGWVYRVDPTVSGGFEPIANSTGHPRIGSLGFRTTVLPNCQIQVSALGTGNAVISVLYDRIKKGVMLDTSGTAPERTNANYVFASLFNPAFPTSYVGLEVGGEKYWAPEFMSSFWYQKDGAPPVELGTYPTTGIKGILYFQACTVK